MDEALRAHLEGMEDRAVARDSATRKELRQEIREQVAAAEERAVARDAATRQEIREQVAAAEERAVARDALLGQQISAVDERSVARDEMLRHEIAAVREELAETRREARVMHEAVIREIRTLGEGLTTHQGDQIRRALDQRDQALIQERVAPLEASAVNHEKRITALEQKA